MGERKPKGADARAQILLAGARVLREEGMEKLTQTRVAREAKVSQGHLTYYFPKKADLWNAVAEHSLQRLVNEVAEFFQTQEQGWMSADFSTRERILALVSFLVRDRERSRLLLAITIKSRDDAELRELALASAARVRQLLVTGMDAGTDAVDIDLALSTLWGIAIHQLVFEHQRPDDYAESLLRRFFGLEESKE